MSDAFYKNLSLIAGMMALVAIFALLIFVANLEIKDLDLWLHIGMGRWIVNHNFTIPDVDILSHSIAGQPWVNHEWLFQVIVYYINNAWGPDGLISMQVILVTLTMLVLIFLGYNREKQLASIFFLMLVSLVYQGRFTIRPDLYSLLFFALYILILSFYIDKRWSLFVLFVIQVVWSNMHGFFFFGPLFVAIGLAAEWIKRHVPLPYDWNKVGRLNNSEYKRMKLILGAVLLACLFNPQGLAGALYPIGVFFQISGESKIFFDKIVELKKPITGDTLFSMFPFPYYRLMIILSALSFFFNRRKIDIGVFLFWLIFLIFSLGAIRNLIYFAFAAYLVFVTNALTINWKNVIPLRAIDKKFEYLFSTIFKSFLVIWLVHYGLEISFNGYFDYDKYERKSEFGGVSLRNYPYKAVDFLVENKIQGNAFNDFNSGAYLVGRTFPDIKVFIDGRTEVYGPQFFKYYQQVWEKDNADAFEEMLRKYNVTVAFMNSVHQPVPGNVLRFLYHSKEWIPVYFDYDAIIFLKDVDMNMAVIDKYAIDLKNWKPNKMNLYRLGPRTVSAFQQVNRAFTLVDLELYEPAKDELEEALKIMPQSRSAHRLLGKIYAKQKDFQKAFEYFRIAVMMKPDDKKLRMNLALSLYDLGELEYAAQQYQKVVDRWPKFIKARFLLSRVYTKQKEYAKAAEALAGAIQLDGRAVKDALEIGDIAMKDEAYPQALTLYQVALRGSQSLDIAYLKVGEALEKLKEVEQAKKAYQKGLEANPENTELEKRLKRLR